MKKEKSHISSCSIPVAATLLKLFFLLPLLFFQSKSMAQSLSVTDAYVTMHPLPADSTIMQGTYIVELSDSNNVANIEVKLGTSPVNNANDVLSRTFVFDSNVGLPAGFSYARSGNVVSLEVGTFSDRSTYFGEVRVQSTNGTWSQSMKFISN